jgi:hypothetical protein
MKKEIPDESLDEVINGIFTWTIPWAEEIASDCIALFLCGIGYMNEIVLYASSNTFGNGSKSHPPTSFRSACQIEILERLGIDVTNLQHFRESIPQLSQDSLSKTLTDMKLVPTIVHWVLEHVCISHLESNWHKILEATSELKDGKTPVGDMEVNFAALSYLTMYMSTELGFSHLRKCVQKG